MGLPKESTDESHSRRGPNMILVDSNHENPSVRVPPVFRAFPEPEDTALSKIGYRSGDIPAASESSPTDRDAEVKLAQPESVQDSLPTAAHGPLHEDPHPHTIPILTVLHAILLRIATKEGVELSTYWIMLPSKR